MTNANLHDYAHTERDAEVPPNPYGLSPDQEAAMNGVLKDLDSVSGIALLAGSAGTGKTYTVKALINKRLTTNTTFREVAATATTHKAASVLSKQIDFPVTTIHSFLGLVVRDNYATGTQFLNKETETENDHVGLLIIDEASMIDANLLKHILEAQDVDGFSILFVGDNCQLPPVEDDPLLFDEFSHVKHTLTKIHRQGAKNPIIQLANGYRDVILGTTSTYPEVKTARSDEGKTEGVFVVDESKFQDLITQACQSGSDYTGRYKILAFRNEVVNRFNSFAREACYKNRAVEASVFVGERFVVNSPVVKDTAVVLRNEEDVTVLRADKDNVLHGCSRFPFPRSRI